VDFPFNIFATAETSDFKFGMQFGFTKTHHKITPKEKNGPDPGLGAPQNWGFPFNISATTEGSDFKICRLHGVEFAHHKIRPSRKRGCGPG